jgi:TPR repeat protein
MRLRLMLVTLLLTSLINRLPTDSVLAQTLEEVPPPVVESPPPSSEGLPSITPQEKHQPSEHLSYEQVDDVMLLSDLRRVVLVSPDSQEARLALAQGLYHIGDLDAAIDECRVATTLNPNNTKAYVQLGIILMAKQDGRAATMALKEAIRLDPELALAHYSLGGAQYSLGHLTAAIQSYRRTLDLQPDFPDARYRLALVLKLATRHREAAQLMEDAATDGVPQAQYFMGNAYRNGQGVEKNLARAIYWWTKAVEFGQQRAAESLSQLRRQALLLEQSDRRRKDAYEGFQQYRDALWADYPKVNRTNLNEPLGVALLKGNQAPNGVSTLFAEAFALSEPAHDELARLYETGLDIRLAQFDARILTCFTTTAADGFIPAKKALARIYGKGIGVTRDLQKAKAMLKGLSKQDSKAILAEIAGP